MNLLLSLRVRLGAGSWVHTDSCERGLPAQLSTCGSVRVGPGPGGARRARARRVPLFPCF